MRKSNFIKIFVKKVALMKKELGLLFLLQQDYENMTKM